MGINDQVQPPCDNGVEELEQTDSARSAATTGCADWVTLTPERKAEFGALLSQVKAEIGLHDHLCPVCQQPAPVPPDTLDYVYRTALQRMSPSPRLQRRP